MLDICKMGYLAIRLGSWIKNLQNCLEAIRSAFPHPLTPSPRAGEGEQETPAPLSQSGRGAGGEGQKLRLFNPRSLPTRMELHSQTAKSLILEVI